MTLRLARLWLASGLTALVPELLAQPVPPASQKAPVAAVSSPAPKPGAALVTKGGDAMVDSFKLSDGDIDSDLSALENYTGRTVVRPRRRNDRGNRHGRHRRPP